VSLPQLVDGRYRLSELIGQGGMGRVWLAHDEVLRRDVAIKEVLLPHSVRPDEREAANRRAMREARAIARLANPHVIRLFDIRLYATESTGDKRPWIVMEYLPSRSLADVVAADGPLPPARVAEIGMAMLGALYTAHRNGVLHRDVKPSNVLLAEDGRIVLTDFGIATVEGDATLTNTGALLGSPAYVAPERAKGHDARPESDLWSLGATLYFAAAGRPPHQSDTAVGTLTAVVSEPPAVLPDVGPLWRALDGLLRKSPERRLDAIGAAQILRPIAGPKKPRPRPLLTRTKRVPFPRQSVPGAATPTTGSPGTTTSTTPTTGPLLATPPAARPPTGPLLATPPAARPPTGPPAAGPQAVGSPATAHAAPPTAGASPTTRIPAGSPPVPPPAARSPRPGRRTARRCCRRPRSPSDAPGSYR